MKTVTLIVVADSIFEDFVDDNASIDNRIL